MSQLVSDDSLNGNRSLAEMEVRQKIRYKPQEIVVEKRPGKRTATAFCSFRAARTKPMTTTPSRSKTNSVNDDDNDDAASNASSVLHFSCDSDHSDSLSIVSDVSELSLLGDVRSTHGGGSRVVPIVGVHGVRRPSTNAKVELKRLTEQLAMFRDQYHKTFST